MYSARTAGSEVPFVSPNFHLLLVCIVVLQLVEARMADVPLVGIVNRGNELADQETDLFKWPGNAKQIQMIYTSKLRYGSK